MIIVPGEKKNLAVRYYANVIDYLMLMILTLIYVFTAGDQDEFGIYRVLGFKALLIPLIWFFCFPVSESLWGQTLGKRVFHLHVVDLKGEPPTIVQTFLRRISDPLELFFLGIPALLIINYSEKNQRIGDMMAGTTVVRTDAVCRFCNTELELLPKEVTRDSFICPTCNQAN